MLVYGDTIFLTALFATVWQIIFFTIFQKFTAVYGNSLLRVNAETYLN